MLKGIDSKKIIIVVLLAGAFLQGSCTTTELLPKDPLLPPVYTQVPHPMGMDVSDLAAIFIHQTAPKEDSFFKTCDENFQRLNTLTNSKEEKIRGVQELVKNDPVHYHWCFYGKLQKLDDEMKVVTYVEE